jgi:uncharacterized protein DUF6573
LIQSNKNPFEGAPIIYSYSRKQAIEDGVLVDLTELAKTVGFLISVACTAAVWHQHVEPREESKALGECELTRTYSLLWTLYRSISKQTGDLGQLMFDMNFCNATGDKETIMLKVICGPGDQGEAVLTIMFPNED